MRGQRTQLYKEPVPLDELNEFTSDHEVECRCQDCDPDFWRDQYLDR